MISGKEKNFISVVAYVHDAAGQLPNFLACIAAVFDANFDHYELILVDDASGDAGLDIIREKTGLVKNGNVQIIHMSCFQGCEMSMNAGVDLAIGDFVFEFDSLLMDYEPETIMDIYRHSLEGYDIVNAAPDRTERWSSRIFYKLYNAFSQYQGGLRSERFRILSRRALNRIHSMSRTIPYRKALYANCGLRQDTLVYNSIASGHEEEKQQRWRMAIDALILFTDIGYRLALILTVGMLLFSLLVACYAVYIFMAKQPILGWTSMILVLSVGFAGMFAVAAIIIKYLDVLLGLVFKRRTYIIRGIEKLTH